MRCFESLADDEQPEHVLTPFEVARLAEVKKRYPHAEFTDTTRQERELEALQYRYRRGDFGGDT